MSWTQAYNAQFAKPLVNQLIAIIQRDQAAALSVINAARAVNGNQPLTPIAEFHKGPGPRTGWPWLSLEIGPTNFDRGADKAIRHHELRINSYGHYLRRRFGCRVSKVNVDAGFTCPNRDGSKGTGGCNYCNNVSFSPRDTLPVIPLEEQLSAGMAFHRQRLGSQRIIV